MTNGSSKSQLSEFDLIDRFFTPLAAPMSGAFGLTDDAATLAPDPGMELVLTKDAMVSGVHFLEADGPANIARKLLRVNLSDLAAMGAMPVGYLLATFWPQGHPTEWIQSFASGLAEDQKEFSIGLLGGDTVRTPGPLCLSLTAIGEIEVGQALRRNGAKIGDLVVVSGTIGDGALGLMAAQGNLEGIDPDQQDWLGNRYHLPQPRMLLGSMLKGLATACADISDGLVADIGHICAASGVGAVLKADDIPLSEAARTALVKVPSLLTSVLSGGDDYELVFTLPAERVDSLETLAAAAQTKLAVIGRIEAGEGVSVLDGAGVEIPLVEGGWQHF